MQGNFTAVEFFNGIGTKRISIDRSPMSLSGYSGHGEFMRART
jgi:hypothetical protein